MKKKLTKKDVFEVAQKLMEEQGETTTLDVKIDLRKMDFFATQEFVSDIMDELKDENDWKFESTGVHRIYYLPLDDISTTDSDDDVNDYSDDFNDSDENTSNSYSFKTKLKFK